MRGFPKLRPGDSVHFWEHMRGGKVNRRGDVVAATDALYRVSLCDNTTPHVLVRVPNGTVYAVPLADVTMVRRGQSYRMVRST